MNEQVYALALWDESWQAHNNCYLVRSVAGPVLIDCGKAEHGDQLVEALAQLDCGADQILHLIATHSHKDHIGAHERFRNATRYIHASDRVRLSLEAQGLITETLPDDGTVGEFRCLLLGHHTPGSVALYHGPTGALFVGDHYCFFGQPLPPDGLVSAGEDLPNQMTSYIAEWAANETERTEYRFDRFIQGISRLASLQTVTALCTGHGGVYKGDVSGLLQRLVRTDA